MKTIALLHSMGKVGIYGGLHSKCIVAGRQVGKNDVLFFGGYPFIVIPIQFVAKLQRAGVGKVDTRVAEVEEIFFRPEALFFRRRFQKKVSICRTLGGIEEYRQV